MKSKTTETKAVPATNAATEELTKFNDLYAKKEHELREINLKRVKNLEVVLQVREEEITKLKLDGQELQKELEKRDALLSESQEQLKQYEVKFEEVKDLLVDKNEKIAELEKSLEEERSIFQEKFEKVKTSEKSLLDKCESFHEEIKSLKWKHDQAIRFVILVADILQN